MNFIKKHFGNVILAIVLYMVAYKQIPLWMHSFNQIGTDFISFKALNINGSTVQVPQDRKKKVFIFWATWCGPCHMQLAQFDGAVKSGDLGKDQVVAVSLDKSIEDLNSFLKEKDYSFSVVMASPDQSWTDLNVQATPSIAFVDDGRVSNFFTGLSPLSVFKARDFLN